MTELNATLQAENKKNLILYMAATVVMYGGALACGLAGYYGHLSLTPAIAGAVVFGVAGTALQAMVPPQRASTAVAPSFPSSTAPYMEHSPALSPEVTMRPSQVERLNTQETALASESRFR